MIRCAYCKKEIQDKKYTRMGELFCSKKCSRSGKFNPSYKGKAWKTTHGYLKLSRNGKQVYEHRYVMEQHLGRKLTKGEVVHHANGDRSDNRIENLEVFVSNSAHFRLAHTNPDTHGLYTCPTCNKEFVRQKTWVKIDTPYCSRQCAVQIQYPGCAKKYICPICGKEFSVKKSRLKKISGKPCCSPSCGTKHYWMKKKGLV